MGLFSSLFKPTKIKQSKSQKTLSFKEEQLELMIQQYESESDLIYKKTGKIYLIDVELLFRSKGLYRSARNEML